MFAVWGVRGPDITQLIYIIERSKRSSLSGIMGKAIPQLGPTVVETLFKEFP